MICSENICAQNKNVVVFHNETNESVYIRKTDVFLHGSFPFVIRNGSDSFRLVLHQEKPTFIYIKFFRSKERQYLIYPMDSLRIILDKSGCPLIVRKNHINNGEVVFMNQLFEDIREIYETKGLSKEISLIERDNYINSIYLNLMRYLESNIDKYNLSESFVKLFNAFALSWKVINKSELQIYRYKYASSIKKFYQKEFKALADSFTCNECTNIYEYKKAAHILSNTLRIPGGEEPQRIDHVFKEPELREFLKAKYFYDQTKNNDTIVRTEANIFLKTVVDPTIASKLADILALKSGVLTKGKSKFVVDTKGNKLEFSEFIARNRGSVIYIDFWASWCLPCKKEFPFSDKLKKKFANKKIVFAYVSIDEEFYDWVDENNALNLGEENSFVLDNPSDNVVKSSFEINSIPRYIIVDQVGNFVDLNASRPSDSKLSEVLTMLLDKAGKSKF